VLHLLKRNAKEQCRLNTQLGRDMWDRLMSPLQGATACVGMYPFLVRRHPHELAMHATCDATADVDCVSSLHAQIAASSAPLPHRHVNCPSSESDGRDCTPARSPTSWPS
jgi:hypothetical protein